MTKSDFLSSQLWSLIGYCILKPVTIGFNMADIEILSNLPEILKGLLHVLQRFLDSNLLDQFYKTMSDLTGER